MYCNTNVFFEFYRQKLDCRNIEPNIAHVKLAELEKSGKRISIITQNIDGLHEKAGSTEIYNIHGTPTVNYCVKCGKKYDANYVFDYDGPIPKCNDEHCTQHGFVRPDITLYGENLSNSFNTAINAVEEADLMIIAGTSLTVFPAASIISYFNGPLVIINRDSTHADFSANLVFRESISDVFSKL